MNHPQYCAKCDAITGHDTDWRHSVCMKCKGVTKTPLLKWTAGVLFLLGIASVSVWVIYVGISVLMALH